MKRLAKILCALLAGIMIIPLAACDAKEPQNGASTQMEKYSIVSAKYPEMAPYPNEEEFIKDNGEFDGEGFEKVQNAWINDIQAQKAGFPGYKGELKDYISKLTQELLKESDGNNAVCSPINIYIALAMLAETTDTTTREEILNLLGAARIEEVRSYAKTIWNAAYIDDGASKNVLANSLWLRDDMEYKEEAFKILAENYFTSVFKGEMGNPDYDKALQDWINEQTGGLLEEQASNLELDPATVLALCSTIYFCEKWNDEFMEEGNEEKTFHGANGDEQVTFMNQSSSQTYWYADKFALVSKPFTNNGEMMFFLPDEGVKPEELLTDEQFLEFAYGEPFGSEIWDQNQYIIVNMSVPKFDVSSDIDLADGFRNLGLEEIFTTKADFTPISDMEGIFLGSAKHAARVKIDEKGCEAAAYTVMAMCGAAMPPTERVDFVLDRPFIFVIKDSNNLPLFVGIVNSVK